MCMQASHLTLNTLEGVFGLGNNTYPSNELMWWTLASYSGCLVSRQLWVLSIEDAVIGVMYPSVSLSDVKLLLSYIFRCVGICAPCLVVGSLRLASLNSNQFSRVNHKMPHTTILLNPIYKHFMTRLPYLQDDIMCDWLPKHFLIHIQLTLGAKDQLAGSQPCKQTKSLLFYLQVFNTLNNWKTTSDLF